MVDLLIFVPACLALNLSFGPNNLLALTHGARAGVWFAQRAAIGRLLVFVPMIAVSALGLGLLLSASATLFQVVKLVGAAYLIYIGFRLWRSASASRVSLGAPAAPALHRAFRTEALVAASNPKAVLIFAAFFPQFVATEAYWQSYAIIGAIFLALEATAIFCYALAGKFTARLAGEKLPWLQRASGATMTFFGALLLFAPQPGRQ